MARRKKMNAVPATPVTEEMKKEPWYAEVSKLPPCMTLETKRHIDRHKDMGKR